MTKNKFNPYDWKFERSSGFAGFRNEKTQEWIYSSVYEEQARRFEEGVLKERRKGEITRKTIETVLSRVTWVQDTILDKVDEILSGYSSISHREGRPKGSFYVAGPARDDEPRGIGIYFYDPTRKELK